MTQLFLNPLTKFTSDNITSLPGARLYFFQNNSSTPKAVYADKAKVTSLGVYVEADSAGIFEPIWLDGTYRAILRYSANWVSDPVGVVQTGWPVDNIGDIGNFSAFAAWDSTFTYDITTNTFVTGPDGLYYQSIQNPNLNKTPASNPSYWQQVRLQAVWNASRSYVEFDIVEWQGKLYSSKNIVNVNHQPPNATYWNDLTFNNNVIGALNVTAGVTALSFQPGNTNIVSGLVLDWYEEGTFTPAIGGRTTAGTGTYTLQDGKFTRIGNVVYFYVKIVWTAHTGTGTMYIRFLPYLSSGNTNTGSIAASDLNFGGSAYSVYLSLSNAEADIRRTLLDGSGASSGVPMDTTGTLEASGFYFT